MNFARYAEKVVLLVRGDGLASTMSQYLIDQIQQTPNIQIWAHASVAELHGDKRLEEVSILCSDTDKIERVPASSIFIFIGALPRTDWLAGLVERDDRGFILTGPDLLRNGERPKGWVLDRDPFLLDPDPASHTAEELLRNADPAGAHYDPDIQAWVTPFLMGSINTRVVRRTQALLSQRFDYQEYARFDSSSVARMALFGGNVFGSILGSGFARRIIKPLLPKPGEGPSEKAMNEGSVECEFIGTAKSGVRVRGVLKGQGDASNRFTVKCLCESAFVLALSDTAQSGAKPGFGGVLTPVTGLGDELTARLRTVGINFEIV